MHDMTTDARLGSLARYCHPVTMGNVLLLDGFDETTPSATMTLVHHDGSVWGVTCRHVAEQTRYVLGEETREDGVWRLQLGRLVFNLSATAGGEVRSLLFALDHGQAVDLAFCNLDHVMSSLREVAGKEAAQLLGAYWPHEPDRSTIRSALAIGFPDRAKRPVFGPKSVMVAQPAALICAPFDPMVDPDEDAFILDTEQSCTAPIGLSGCSGGPIFGLPPLPGLTGSWEPVLEGIIFQGLPAHASQDQLPEEPVQIWGLRISDSRMRTWLTDARPI